MIMFADLERYKSLEKDLLLASILNQFSGLVYVPELSFLTNRTLLQTAGGVTINVDNATCVLDGNATVYAAYFIPGYIDSTANIINRFGTGIDVTSPTTSLLELFDNEVLITHIDPKYWYPNTYPIASWGRPRQQPFKQSFFFHIGTSKTYGGLADYYQYDESGLFLQNLSEAFTVNPAFNNNANVKVTASSLTYQQYTSSSGVIQSLPKNTIINYVKRFPDRLV